MDFSPSVYEHAAKLIGQTPWSVSRSADLLYQAHATAYQRYQHSPITVGIDIYNLEAEAYGAIVDEPAGDNIPTISKPICSALDDLLGLEPFDPTSSRRLPVVLSVGKKLVQAFPQADVRIPVSGPVSIASTLMGVEGFLIELLFNPDKARQALHHLAEGQVIFCREIQRQGLDVTFFESAATPPLLSPHQFRNIALPVLKTMMQQIAEIMGHAVAFVIGGDTTPILEAIIETGTKYVICPSETDQKAFVEKIWPLSDVTVRINMDPKIIAFGGWQEIKKEVDRIITLANGRDNVCLGTGALPYETPPENVEKVREYLRMLKKDVSIALVGIGGYGLVYLEGLLDQKKDEHFKIVGAIDPEPQRCNRLSELKVMDVPIFNSLEEFYSKGHADLIIISSPIHMHCPQTCLALSHGSNVLCEKPLGATIQEATEMIRAMDESGKFVAIGYQWSFSDAIQELKQDIQRGVLGAPKRLKTIALWPRDEAYYNRNNWAGKKKDELGNWVLDSPANNALAHYLHNMFYILGAERNTSARPERVVAELYRANPIENFDTVAARIYTESGVEILFYGSHATENELGPIISYEFEKADVKNRGLYSDMVAKFQDGSAKNYGTPDTDQVKKMWDAIRAVRIGEKIACSPEASSAQTLCVNGMQESMPEIVNFPDALIHTKGEIGNRLVHVEGLENILCRCYKENILPSELELPWSKKGKEILLTNYHSYPAGP